MMAADQGASTRHPGAATNFFSIIINNNSMVFIQ